MLAISLHNYRGANVNGARIFLDNSGGDYLATTIKNHGSTIHLKFSQLTMDSVIGMIELYTTHGKVIIRQKIEYFEIGDFEIYLNDRNTVYKGQSENFKTQKSNGCLNPFLIIAIIIFIIIMVLTEGG
ncbi:MAG: hypothetical protein GQ574_26700 [Crocinitomix sp.]|nr:hypothetical protein [Crocinitomix sp.]